MSCLSFTLTEHEQNAYTEKHPNTEKSHLHVTLKTNASFQNRIRSPAEQTLLFPLLSPFLSPLQAEVAARPTLILAGDMEQRWGTQRLTPENKIVFNSQRSI